MVLRTSALHDVEIAITGRLAAMSRKDAITRLRRIGARYVDRPGPATRLLVLGSDGPPGRGGRPTRCLLRARELQRRGCELEIVAEEEFLARLDDDRPEIRRLYTLAQLSRILDIPSTRIRSWIRAGLLRPVRVEKRLCYFEFSHITTARRLGELTAQGTTPARILHSLQRLSGWIPGATPTSSQLELIGDCGPLLVRLEDGRLAEAGGQLLFDFAGRCDVETRQPRILHPKEQTAEDWFNLGIAAEEAGNLESAVEAYQNALTFGDPPPEVCFNLGNTLYAMGRNVEAAAYFIRATEIDPDYVEAWNNLGNALAEIGRYDEAVAAYEQALNIAPSYADAHYNLGETLALLDDEYGAARHWVAYLKQDPNSPWAHRVRARLSELAGAR